MKKFIQFLIQTLLLCLLGGIVSTATGINPVYGMAGMAITGNMVMPVVTCFLPQGILMVAPVFKTAYEAELLKSLRSIKNGFLARIPDRSDLLEANTIDYTKIGAKPDVLIDNTVYPIPGSGRVDEGLKIMLRKLTTKHTVITRDEIHNLPYDKTGSVIEQHKEALLEKFNKLALYSFCPAAATATMPVLTTTGANDGTGRKRLTLEDLIKFRTAISELGIDQCDLVLSNQHAEDIMLWSQAFVSQYHIIASGLVLPLYGFNLLQNQGYAPVFNGTAKKAFEAVATAGDVTASVAYLPNRLYRAYGDVEMFYTPANAEYHEDKVNFDAYFIATPKDNEGTAAIISSRI